MSHINVRRKNSLPTVYRPRHERNAWSGMGGWNSITEWPLIHYRPVTKPPRPLVWHFQAPRRRRRRCFEVFDVQGVDEEQSGVVAGCSVISLCHHALRSSCSWVPSMRTFFAAPSLYLSFLTRAK